MEFIPCYYDTDTSGQNDTGTGEPRTTTEMKALNTFINWDFDAIWNLNSGINNGYPHLIWGGLTGIYARPYCSRNAPPERTVSLRRGGIDIALYYPFPLTSIIIPCC
jgi:hypothetical protein